MISEFRTVKEIPQKASAILRKKMTKNGFNMRKKISGFLGLSGFPGSRTFLQKIPGIGIFFRGMGNPDKKPPLVESTYQLMHRNWQLIKASYQNSVGGLRVTRGRSDPHPFPEGPCREPVWVSLSHTTARQDYKFIQPIWRFSIIMVFEKIWVFSHGPGAQGEVPSLTIELRASKA